MRLRIMELPSKVEGDQVSQPFVWVVDKVGCGNIQEYERIRDTLRNLGGAADAIVFDNPVDLD